jgi:hypothetical protein
MIDNKQIALQQETARLLGSFQERFKAVAPPDLEKLAAAARLQGVDIPQAAHDALISIPGGPEAFVHLLKNPQEIARLAQMQPHVQAAFVAQIAGRATQPKRAISSAPAPIKPVGGSATKSSVPSDQMPYQEFKALREREIKARYRR